MIGFGGGVAVEGVPSFVEEIDVIELEQEVVNANRRLAGRRASDPLEDPRLNLVVNDARNALRLTDKTWDVIVSQPSHPWTAGASHLFTREFAGLVKDRLSPGGVFLQWMNAEFLDRDLLRTLAATVLDTFENVRRLFGDGHRAAVSRFRRTAQYRAAGTAHRATVVVGPAALQLHGAQQRG